MAGLLSIAAVCILWLVFCLHAISERNQSLQQAEQRLVDIATAYGEHASSLLQLGIPIPVKGAASGQYLAGPSNQGRKALALFRSALVDPDIELTIQKDGPEPLPTQHELQSGIPGRPQKEEGKASISITVPRPNAGIAVTAVMSNEMALKDWHRTAMLEFLLVTVISLLGAGSGAMLVTQLRRRESLQMELIEAKELADSGSRAKSEFLASMSHEIRTPMNGILGMTELLLETSLSPEQRKYALTVCESGEALLAIVNDILDISKLESGKLDVEYIDFDLLTVVESAVSLMAAKAVEKSINLGSFVDPGARGIYKGDPARLRQVLLNLVGNAIKFTERGSVSVQVFVQQATAASSGKTELRFEVCDTGIGIPENAHDRLFQKFSQADGSVTRRYGGTGLGLAICRQLIELMGGQIGVSSQAGKGSLFWFELRLENTKSSVRNTQTLPERLQGMRALVVDDTDIQHNVLVPKLQALGMSVHIVRDEYSAIAEVKHALSVDRPFGIAFIGTTDSDIAGHRLSKCIRSHEGLARTRLIVLSPPNLRRLLPETSAIFDAAIDKPISECDLQNGIAQAFGWKPSDDGVATGKLRISSDKPLRILLAEDNKINQEFATAVLEGAGHSVIIAENGHEAVAAVQQETFDLVLMDVQMPDLDGIGATKQIRALPDFKARTPIIAMTANAMAGAEDVYLAVGMDDYIAKPVKIATLMEKLSAVSKRTNDSYPFEVEVSLDELHLDQLSSIISMERVGNLLSLFLSDGRVRTSEIAQANDDLKQIGRNAHILVSGAGNIGATKLSAIARKLEEACRDEEFELVRRLSADATVEFEKVTLAIRSWLNFNRQKSARAS